MHFELFRDFSIDVILYSTDPSYVILLVDYAHQHLCLLTCVIQQLVLVLSNEIVLRLSIRNYDVFVVHGGISAT